MRRVIEMELNQSEQEELQKRMKHEQDRRLYERYQTLYLYGVQGMSIKKISEIIRRTEVTVRTYIHSYQENGLDGLAMRFSTGAPERLSSEQQGQLKHIIMEKLPHEVGFTAKHNWTLHLASEYVRREFAQSYTLAGMAKLLHRLDLRFTKPTYTLAAADEEKQKEFIEERFPQLKKDT